ncbi:uncharacterized protein E0L32_003189 [Thyridium curvatum]|uniref:Uncharacterized protein n=1 Tax=Thyridium curvatum TaxID=1093900 RepID=A0A507BE03_9PEZI|nr:uncharacterized protein E0L32_003189 [Thyridium curvatum]TPX17546.1 hypothetical protein E0L32_003189 [Thyridium curvatum]
MVRWCSALLSLALARSALAAVPIGYDPGQKTDIVPGAYIVEFNNGQNDESSFYSDLQSKGLPASKRMTLSYSLFKGSSFQLDKGIDVDPVKTTSRIASIPVVKKVWPVRIVPLPDSKIRPAGFGHNNSTVPPAPSLARRAPGQNGTLSTHVQTQVDKLLAAGVTGKGIRIGIIDTGVDYRHPALGGCFGPGCPVSFGTDLVGDDYNGYNTPRPDPDPLDTCQGHGTHVAGIIGAQRERNELGFSGAAPGAELGMYKVFGCVDNTATDVLVAAFNRAYEDGCDVITCSIGGNSGWAEDPWAVAVSRIVAAGVPCTVAAGNSGSAGLFYASTAADGRGVTAVASVENIEIPLVLVEGRAAIGEGCGNKTSFGWMEGRPKFPNVTLPLWVVTPNYTTDGAWNACNPLSDDTPDLKGKIVLVEYAICSDWVIANNLVAKGAEYIMIYYNQDSFAFSPVIDDLPTLKGLGMTTYQQGKEWRQLLTSGVPILVKITDPVYARPIAVSYPNTVGDGGLVNYFSSWGPTWEVGLYPHFAAVGGDVLSTFPLDLGAFAVASGTSMATPQTAAVMALLMQHRGIRDPQTLMSLLSSTAQAKPFIDYDKLWAGLAPVPQQGAGLVQAWDAANARTVPSPSSVSFNDTEHLVGSATVTLRNTGGKAVTFSVGHVPALTMYTYNTERLYPAPFPNPIAEGAAAKLSFSADVITVPAGGSAELTIRPTPPAGLDEKRLPVYSGYVVLNGTNGENLAVPYLGVAGSMYSAPKMLDPERTFTFRYSNLNLDPIPADSNFTLPIPTSPELPPGTEGMNPLPNLPAAVMQLDAGTSLLRCDIVALDAPAGVPTTDVLGVEVVGSIGGFPAEWVPRRYFVKPFTGMTQEGKILPAGRYAFLVRGLRIFGDRENAADYDALKLLPFNIEYKN